MRYGFINKNGRSEVPLEKIQIRGCIKGFTAEVVATMDYKNNSDNPIEAMYVFPLDEEAAVCGFQASIDGRTIVAEIQEKQEARDTYDDAISSGHSAFLLEESDESSDIFQINVGNLPPHQSASIELTFVTTLKVEKEGKVVFVLPTVLNPRYSPSDSNASISTTMDSLASVSSQYSFDFEMNVQCASSITEITSPRHQLKVDITPDNKQQAIIKLDKDSYKFDADLEVQVLCSNPFQPHALAENGAATGDEFLSKSVVMVNFFPEFDSSASLEKGEFIFVVDRSGSMGGSNIKSARETLLLFLKSLPEDCYFNIVGFGSSFEKLFEKSECYNDKSLKRACSHSESMDANLGGTEILRPLQDVFAWPLIKGYPRQVFILTDGDVGNTQQVIDLVKSNSAKARCFTFGIGAGASTALVKGVARAGKGVAEFVAHGEKMQSKVIKVLKNALQPALLDCKVTWDLPKECLTVETIPQVPPAIFSGNSLIIYGLVSGDSSIKGSVTISGALAVGSTDKQIEHKVSLEVLNSPDNSYLLHRLAAKTFIQEKQDADSDAARESIISISKSANVVSKLTSFVAVDEHSKEPISSSMSKRIRQQDIDEVRNMLLANIDAVDARSNSTNAILRCKKSTKSFPNPLSWFGSFFSGSKSGKSMDYSTAEPNPPPCYCRKSMPTTGEFNSIPMAYDAAEFSSDDESDDIPPYPALQSISSDERKSSKQITLKNTNAFLPPKGCLEIVSLQKASGAWELTDELASICGTSLDELKQKCPSQLTTGDKDNLWATALALACLNGKYSDQKDEWEMVAEKGTKWLKKHLFGDGLSFEEIMEMAAVVLDV